MELSHKAATALAKTLKDSLGGKAVGQAEVVVCPSYPSLAEVAGLLKAHALPDGRQAIQMGAQNIHHEERGAFTGQVSVLQLTQFVQWCIVGHSEVREFSGEEDDAVVAKANLLLQHGVNPIICVGETAEEKNVGQTVAKITSQLEAIMAAVPRTSLLKAVIAYEPIWAIGSGVTPEPDDVAEIVLLMRKLLAGRFDGQLADRVRILYGGSVKPENVRQYVGGPYADGVLVGGASVHAGQFTQIVQEVAAVFP
jgi:triosephosphate isomerase